MTEAFVLSNFDTHVFMCPYVNKDTIPESGQEIEDIISLNVGEITKDTKTYKTLTNNGWDSIAILGQSVGDISISFIRQATGKYTGASGDDAYRYLRSWFDGSLGADQINAMRNVIVVKPRKGASGIEYEGMLYHVLPKNWTDGAIDPDNGQEFSITMAAFLAPIPVAVTKSAGGAFSFGSAAGDVYAYAVTPIVPKASAATLDVTVAISPLAGVSTLYFTSGSSGIATVGSSGVSVVDGAAVCEVTFGATAGTTTISIHKTSTAGDVIGTFDVTSLG